MKNSKNILGKIAHQPVSHFALLFVVMAVVQVLAINGVVTSSFAYALGNTMIYAIIAIGFCLLLGYSGLASLATAGFVGIGAYIGFYIMQELELPFIVALVVVIVAAVVIGGVVGFISLRIEGVYLAVLTMGLSEILRNLFMAIKSVIKIDVNHARIFGIKLGDSGAYFLALVVLCVLLWLTSNLTRSPTGRAMLAMKNSTSAAQAMGISLIKFRLMAFIISTVYAGIGGLVYMLYVRTMATSTSLVITQTTSLNILGAVVIGGAKSLWGTMFGIFIIYGVQATFLSKIPFFVENPAFMTMVTGLLIILVVMFFPGGFAQMANQFRAWSKKKFGKKEVA